MGGMGGGVSRAREETAARARLSVLRGLVLRYRRHLEEGASQRMAAAYSQGLHEAEAEIAEIERNLAASRPRETVPTKGSSRIRNV